MSITLENIDANEVTLYFDPSKADDQNFYFNVVILDFGRVSMVIPKSLLEGQELDWFADPEIARVGTRFTDIINFPKLLTGTFQRYRKTPTSPIVLRLVLTSIVNKF